MDGQSYERVLVFLPIENLILKNQQAYYQALDASNKAADATQKSSPKTEEKIVSLLKEDPSHTAEQIGKMLDISKRAVLKQINKLKNEGRLLREGPAKSGRWKVLPLA